MTKYRFKVGDIFIYNGKHNYIIGKITKTNRYGDDGQIFTYKIIKEDRLGSKIDYSEFYQNSAVYNKSKILKNEEELMIEML